MSEPIDAKASRNVATVLFDALIEEDANIVKAEEEMARTHSAFMVCGERAVRLRGAVRCLGHETVPLPNELAAEAIRELKQIERRVQGEVQ